MRVLGIDTATATASAALVEDGRLVLEELCCAPDPGGSVGRGNHAETLLPLIEALLRKAGVPLPAVAALAISLGPGSFTGLRIGLSTVKGLAYGWGIPVVGVPTLPAVASRVTDWEGIICPFLDARKKEVYAALFCRRGAVLERVSEDFTSAPGAVIERVAALDESEPCLFIGDGIKSYGELIAKALGGRSRLTLGEGYPSVACAVAQLAQPRLTKGDYDQVGALVPLYLRPSEAELKRRGYGG